MKLRPAERQIGFVANPCRLPIIAEEAGRLLRARVVSEDEVYLSPPGVASLPAKELPWRR